MKLSEYAIVDIETTGGNASGSRITEIAIVIHDGNKITERWETLVNPENNIPLPIFALTGINNEMVQNAPTFDNIAEKVFEMLSDRIFVAHNVNFDYSFIRHQLDESGFKWSARKLCTVRASRKIRPGLASYSLGKLCKALEIPLQNQHRAGGDAAATAILFTNLLLWDENGEISKMLKNTSKEQQLPPNLPKSEFEQLPERTGIYYFYNEFKKVIYVGKAVNIKKRVASHFTGNNINLQRQNFLKDIYSISCEICGSEFIALLLECTEIKKLWPVYNKALKRFEPKFGLYQYEARNGYRYLAIGKVAKGQIPYHTFDTLHEGINVLLNLSKEFNIDSRFCSYGMSDNGILSEKSKSENLPDINLHNSQIEEALGFLTNQSATFLIIDKGRESNERSCILVIKGHFYGMGYLSVEDAIVDIEDVKNYLTQYKSNQYMVKLILGYADKFPNMVKRFDLDI